MLNVVLMTSNFFFNLFMKSDIIKPSFPYRFYYASTSNVQVPWPDLSLWGSGKPSNDNDKSCLQTQKPSLGKLEDVSCSGQWYTLALCQKPGNNGL